MIRKTYILSVRTIAQLWIPTKSYQKKHKEGLIAMAVPAHGLWTLEGFVSGVGYQNAYLDSSGYQTKVGTLPIGTQRRF